MTDASGDDPPDESYGRRPGSRLASAAVIRSGRELITTELALTIFRQMVRTRALEERSIKMSKSGEAYFWVGGPGEEAFNVCLGMQVKRGAGPAYDYLHLHYRSAGTLLAMGMPMADHVRTLAMTTTDRHSMGRNFVGHYAIPEWNVIPVTSVIEVQMVMAPGTALMQKRHGGDGLSIAVSGDAGTAEGDFESCLLWSSRPGNELPVLAAITNNGWGISTSHESQHAVKHIADRAEPYGIRHETIDGNDPVACWHGIDRAMRYVRRERRPFVLEAMVSRLHGHSSSSGAQRQHDQPDPLALFEQKLIDAHAIDAAQVREMKQEARDEANAAVVQATSEPKPTKLDVYTHTYAPSSVDAVYPQDYTGLPGVRGERMATLVQAVRLALHYGEEHLGVTDVFGEDVGPPLGGVFTATQGLRTAWNSPLDERGIVGMAMGIAYAGGRPVCEIQFCDYAFNVIDLLKVAGNQRWGAAGNYAMPLVVMTPTGSGIRGSLYHSHSFESWASRLAGWKIVLPSNPLDAYGLITAAIKDPNPVLVLLPKALLRAKGTEAERLPGEPADPDELNRAIDAPVGDRSGWAAQWPDLGEYIVPIGKARLAREGLTATVVSYGRLLPLAVQAADELERDFGYTYDVIDLRSIFPYDWSMVSGSIQKTGRLLIVNEDTEVTNFGEHLLRRAIDDHFYDLLAKPRVLMGEHLPGIGMNQVYEENSVPQYDNVRDAMRDLAAEQV